LICNFSSSFSSFGRSHAVNPEVKSYDCHPEILPYSIEKKSGVKWSVSPEDSKKSFLPLLTYFCAVCEQNKIRINENNVAVLFRGWKQGELLDIRKDLYDYERNPWKNHNYHVKDILKGLVLYNKGLVKEGYKLVEKGYFEAIHKPSDINFHCTNHFIEEKIERKGFRFLRDIVFAFIRMLPTFEGRTIRSWVYEANDSLKRHQVPIRLEVENSNADILIEDYFAGELNPLRRLPFYCGTIHSAKGRTFDAVFLLISKRAGSTNYTTLLDNGMHPSDQEELRNIYVAITRPRKILMLAVPGEDLAAWRRAFYNPGS